MHECFGVIPQVGPLAQEPELSLTGEPLTGRIVPLMSPEGAFAAQVLPELVEAMHSSVQDRLRQVMQDITGQRGQRAPRETVAVPLPELYGLHVPRQVPGGRESEPLTGIMRLIARYRHDGSLIDGTLRQIKRQSRVVVKDGKRRVLARTVLRRRGGPALEVITIFTCRDFADEGPPALWATRVYQAQPGCSAVSEHQWRYVSREAALHGHHLVVGVLRAASRTRPARPMAHLAMRTVTPRASDLHHAYRRRRGRRW